MQCWSSRAGSQGLFHNWVGTAVYVGRMACLRCTAAQSTSSTMLAQLLLAPSSNCCCCLRSDTAWAKVFYAPAPNTGWTLHADMFSSWWGCRFAVLWSEHPSRWPQWLLATVLTSFLPKNVLHDKNFPCAASQDRRGSRRRCVERHRDVCESSLCLGCSFTSHSVVNCTFGKCYMRVLEFEQQQKQN